MAHASAERPLRIALLGANKVPGRVHEDPSFRYRCDHLATALRGAGHRVWTGHQRHFPWWEPQDCVVFHRPRDTLRLRLLLALLRARGSRVLADVDDLVFDPALAAASPAVVNGRRTLAAMQAEFRGNAAALRRIGALTVSTAPLADHAARAGLRVLGTVPNAVPPAWQALPPPADAAAGPPVLSYCPGTPSHDHDFAQIAPLLQALLARHPQVRLEITGPLATPLQAAARQLLQRPKLPFEQFHTAVQAARVNLAPLADSPFNRCKSALKVIEAGCWGIPTVVSPLPDAERFRGCGAVIAATPQDWTAALESLLLDDAAHRRHSTGLAARMRAAADAGRIAADWLQQVMEVPGGR